MLIWRGMGIVVAGIFIASVIFSVFVQEAMAGQLSDKHAIVLAFVLTGALCWFIGVALANKAKRDSRDMIDVNTGESVSIREHHDFFFVPVRFWAFVAWALALAALLGAPADHDFDPDADWPPPHQQLAEDEPWWTEEDAPPDAPRIDPAVINKWAQILRPPGSSPREAEAELGLEPGDGSPVAAPPVPSPPVVMPPTAEPAVAAAAPAVAGVVHSDPWPAPRTKASANGVITMLDFVGNLEFTDGDLAKVAEVSTLTHLDLSYSGITAAGLVHLKDHPSLRSLRLDRCPVSGGLEPLANIPHLVTLKAEGANLTDSDIGAIGGLTGLTELRLGENAITTHGIRALTELANLRVIDLHGTRVNDAVLVHLQRLTALAEIDVRDTEVGKPIILRFAQLRPGVKVLHGRYVPPVEPATSVSALAAAAEARAAQPPAAATPAAPAVAGPPPVAAAPAEPQVPIPPLNSVRSTERTIIQTMPPQPDIAPSPPAWSNMAHEDRMVFVRGESKMARLAFDLRSHAARNNRVYPNTLDALDRRFLMPSDLRDEWGDPYLYMGRGVAYEFGAARSSRRIILATAKPHADHRIVAYSDGRIETITEESFTAIAQPRH